MDNSKKVAIAAVLVLVIVLACMMIFKNDGETKERVDNTPVNKSVDIAKVFEAIEKIEGFEKEDFSGEIHEEPNEDEPVKKEILNEANIDFGKYNVLEKKAIVKTTDEYVNEVWIIKLGDIKQQEDVVRILGNRLQKLKNAFAGDRYQTAVLNNAIIKQEDGIVVMIISPNDDEIEKTIAEVMEEK